YVGLDETVALGECSIPLDDLLQLSRHLLAQGFKLSDSGSLFGHAAIVRDQNVCAGTTLVDNRIQSTPAHSHSNCSRDNSHFASPERGQWKRPACSRRTHSHTPVPSISSSLIREPLRLRNTYPTEPEAAPPLRCTHTSSRSIPQRRSIGSTARSHC